ncbi:glycosyltransferase family 4 protein [Pectobacterium brasiliense]|uniref:Glycosyltransferase family 4 protein n=2 Tax=Pectobacterium TaxID=122277 RepID=A0AAW9HJQ0_9GAMM|nr:MULTISPECIES: glycosyltransferase family 4 protein [Pectobacterium]MDY4380633.1 glycosyltransferase family 4 protein [Pectobacterium brasiliense]UUE35080.1 glycosyltransferase family 4 protein [Pectobacterium aroidearum]
MAKLLTRIPSLINSYKSDVTLLSREILPGYPTIEALYRGPIITDIDDAIWLNKPFGYSAAKNIAKRSDKIIVGNSYLAEWFSNYNKNIDIIPTAVSVGEYKSCEDKNNIIIGWIGTKDNLIYVYEIMPALKKLLDKYPSRIKFLIVADEKPCGFENNNNFFYRKWSRDSEKDFFDLIDIGIMPLSDNEWTRGKCSFKLLQYLSYGKVAVASPVGMNISVIKNSNAGYLPENIDEWYMVLDELIQGFELRKIMGEAGFSYVKNNFSIDVISKKIVESIKELA